MALLAWSAESGYCEDALHARPQSLFAVEVFTLPKQEALHLSIQGGGDEALYEGLSALASDRSEVRESFMLLRHNNRYAGEMVSLEETDEWIYGTEMDPAEIPQVMMLGDGALLEALSRMLQPEKEETKPQAQAQEGTARSQAATPARPLARHPANGGLGTMTSVTPTAFEMRPCGARMRLRAIFAPAARSIDVHYEIEAVKYLHDVFYNGEPEPLIASRTLTSRATLHDGLPTLLGTLNPKRNTGVRGSEGDERMSFVFMKARNTPQPVAKAEELDTDKDWRLRFEAFSLPAADAVALWEAKLEDAAVRMQLREKVTAGTVRAEIVLAGSLRALGDRCTMQHGETMKYPTEFDSPEIPQSLFVSDPKMLADLRAGRQTETGIAPPDGSPHNGGFGLITTVMPSAFEERHLGAKVEVMLMEDHGKLEAVVSAEKVGYLGNHQILNCEQPSFRRQAINTSVTVVPGVPCLLGTMSPPKDSGVAAGQSDGRVWMTFLTVGGQ